ncbi:MAG: GHKL domain-containing protein, partial [Nitrospinota bacterium]
LGHSVGFFGSTIITALIIHSPLPRFIFPGQVISRPVDLGAALGYLVVFLLFLRAYTEEKEHTYFMRSMLASIGFGFLAQLYMVHSQQLYDAQFDLSHTIKIVSYMCPLFGVAWGIFELLKRERQLSARLRASIEREKTLAAAAARVEVEKRKAEELRRLLQEVEHTKCELERSNKELEQFAYVASHDLQEPLRMVASYTQLLARHYEGQLDEKASKYIHYIVDGATRMQTLINDLLTLSRVGTRGNPLEPTDCQEVMAEVLENLERKIAETGAEIVIGQLPMVMADRTQLGQVFQNLIDNAMKFRSAAPPRVEITAHRQNGWWEICVADNGIGIEPQYHERIFTIFQRLHARGTYPGTGIGLAIVKKVVERHGGRVWVESTCGKGSRFFFTLPAVKREEDTT